MKDIRPLKISKFESRFSYTALVAAGLLPITSCSTHHETYAESCAVPPAGLLTKKDGLGHLQPIVVLALNADGRAKYAGEAVSPKQLEGLLQQANQLEPTIRPIFDPAPTAPCDQVRRVRKILLSSKICHRDGKPNCSEGHYDKAWPIFGGP